MEHQKITLCEVLENFLLFPFYDNRLKVVDDCRQRSRSWSFSRGGERGAAEGARTTAAFEENAAVGVRRGYGGRRQKVVEGRDEAQVVAVELENGGASILGLITEENRGF